MSNSEPPLAQTFDGFLWENASAFSEDPAVPGNTGAVKSKYPFNNAIQTESGHSLELDDSPGAERVRLYHRNGSFIEMHPDGTVVHKSQGKFKVVIEKDGQIGIKGQCSVSIQGDCNLTVGGNLTQKVNGNFTQDIGGDYNMICRGNLDFTTRNIYMEATNASGTSGGIKFMAPEEVRIQSELDVDLGIRGESILSRGFISAGAGIHAGIPVYNPAAALAGISTLGSISAGSSAAPPVPGFVTATIMVTAPLIFGVVVSDIRGPMELIRLTFDFHQHPFTDFIKGGAVPNKTFLPVPLM